MRKGLRSASAEVRVMAAEALGGAVTGIVEDGHGLVPPAELLEHVRLGIRGGICKQDMKRKHDGQGRAISIIITIITMTIFSSSSSSARTRHDQAEGLEEGVLEDQREPLGESVVVEAELEHEGVLLQLLKEGRDVERVRQVDDALQVLLLHQVHHSRFVALHQIAEGGLRHRGRR